MSNTLTNLYPTLYSALDVVSRELVGAIPAVLRSMKAERAALNQTIRIPVAPAQAAGDITPAATGPDPASQTIGSVTLSITKARKSDFYWEGEEELGLRSGDDPIFDPLLRDQFAQAMRDLTNEAELDLAGLYAKASRATGVPGTTPFVTNLGESADALKVLKDNGAPTGDLHMVVDTGAGAQLRTLGQLTKANEAGTDATLRRGEILDVNMFKIGESAQILEHTKGGAINYVVDEGANYAVGDTALHVDTGTGALLAGDHVAFAGDDNLYMVTTGFPGDGDQDLVIAEPGLREALLDGVAMTVGNTAIVNMFFSRNAIALATRTPALPKDGDSADDRTIIQDPNSGLSFEVAVYKQYRRVSYWVGIVWGYEMIKPEHAGVLLG